MLEAQRLVRETADHVNNYAADKAETSAQLEAGQLTNHTSSFDVRHQLPSRPERSHSPQNEGGGEEEESYSPSTVGARAFSIFAVHR